MTESKSGDLLFSIVLETGNANKRLVVAVSGLPHEEAIEEAVSAAQSVLADLHKSVTAVRPAEFMGETDLAGTPIPSHPRVRLIDPNQY
jgi:hypothetical protein